MEDFDSDFMRTRGFHLDFLDLEGLAWGPAHGGLALDHLSRSFGHDLGTVSPERLCSIGVWDDLAVQHLRKAVAPLHSSSKPCGGNNPLSFLILMSSIDFL